MKFFRRNIFLLGMLLSFFCAQAGVSRAQNLQAASLELQRLHNINALLDKAEKKFEDQEYAAAVDLYTQALDKEAEDAVSTASILIGRGMAYFENGQTSEAMDDYSRAIALDPSSPAGYTFRGQAYQYLGDYDNAVKDFTNVIRLDPASGYALRAQAYLQQRDFERAINDFSTMIGEDLGTAYGYTQRGVAYKNNGEFEKAVADLTQAIEINETEESDGLYVAQLYLHRAEGHFGLREYAKASSDVERARSLGGHVNPGFSSQLEAQMKKEQEGLP